MFNEKQPRIDGGIEPN